MIGFLIGVLVLFGGVIIGAGSLLLGLLPLNIAMLVMTGLTSIVSIYVLIVYFITGGIGDAFASARMNNKQIATVLGNDKRIRFVSTKLEGGLGKNKFGLWTIVPDSVYLYPNGVTGFIAYYKHGISLNPKFVRATTRLKDKGVTDIEQVMGISNTKFTDEKGKVVAEGKDMKIDLDENINNAQKELEDNEKI